MSLPHPLTLAEWTARNAVRLAELGPHAPFDDLAPLLRLIGDARVVALGENSHRIREFGLLRDRMVRFLVQECGFTVYAVEFGAAAGRAVDAWTRGGDGDLDVLLTPRADGYPGQSAESRDTVRWLRAHNATAPHPVHFAGLDVPAAGGSLAPALEPVAAYLADVDPGAERYARTALALSEPLAGGSGLVPAHARLGLDPASQDRLSTALGRLLNRVTVMREIYVEHGGHQAYENVLSDVWAAWRTDQMQRAMSELLGGAPDAADLAARDRYLADSLWQLLDRSRPGTRIVVAAHNAHIQRTANPKGGPLARTPMGHPLAQQLGTDYVSVALTSGGGRTVTHVPDPAHPAGMRESAADAPEAVPDSVEALFAGVPEAPALVDTRALRAHARRHGLPEPARIRMDDGFLPVPALEAYDAVVSVPSTTLTADLAE
ncbi:erythromycin esterase [Streptomyces albospinus]|uniref:Erythromycin esterase n=1 Tax=Streptomyces albospinus TaxID=285515 RepID=A0ABQ2V839_9ACTN|nr:erythromycin esterase family protein [Streptomyces albospinus]GGU72704.1 erythromycin esterase [Streptomyces albospinus]